MNFRKKKPLLTFLFTLLLSFIFVSSYAQVVDTTKTTDHSIKGKVIDAHTTHVIRHATVSIAGKNKSDVTDKNGAFGIQELSTGTYTVTIKADNYQTWKKKLTLAEDMDQLTIKLKPKQ